jgi:protein O-mannosyl-transferase
LYSRGVKPIWLKTTQRESREVFDRQGVWICLGLVLLVLAVFGQVTHFQFVDFDDELTVYENPVVKQGLTAQSVGWAFTHVQVANWVPLTTLSHMLDCELFGVDAGGHHLVNVLFHAASVVLLFLVLREMTGNLWRSALVAAVFAVHPLRAESVAWVSERKDVLSGFFFLLTLGAYVRYIRQPSRSGYVWVALFFVFGLMSKGMVATLPFVLLLLDFWPLGRMERGSFWGLVKEKIPLFLISIGSCVGTALVPGLVVTDHNRIPFLQRAGNAFISYLAYLRTMVFPTKLQTLYLNPLTPRPLWKGGLALVAVLAISAGVVWWWKKRPYLLLGWLWYLGMLFPVIGIVQISPDASRADRYTYLPGIGIAIAAVWVVGDWSVAWKFGRGAVKGLAVAVIGILAICAHRQVSFWRDDLVMWTHNLDCDPHNYMAHYNVGHLLAQQGDLEDAMKEYHAALEIKPTLPEAHNNLGAVLVRKGDLDGAIGEYQRALETDPRYSDAYNNMGVALVKKGKVEEAIAYYHKALELSPEFEDAYYDLGNALRSKGDLPGAIAQYRRALQIAPWDGDARDNLGDALVKNGDVKAAMAEYGKALENTPNDVKAMNNLAWLLATTPDASLRNGATAAALATQADQLSGGGNPIFMRTLAAADAEEGHYVEAAAAARRGRTAALAQKNEELAAKLAQDAKLYEAGKPLREAVAAGDKTAKP